MNVEFLKKAHERVPSVPVLVNLISKREKQLIAGEKPLVMPESSEEERTASLLPAAEEERTASEVELMAVLPPECTDSEAFLSFEGFVSEGMTGAAPASEASGIASARTSGPLP